MYKLYVQDDISYDAEQDVYICKGVIVYRADVRLAMTNDFNLCWEDAIRNLAASPKSMYDV